MKTKTTLMALAMFVLLASATAYPQNCYPDVNTGKISKATPALIFFEGKLHMLHLGDNSNEIWYSTFDGNTWTENVPIGQQSKVTPVMTVFNDRLHMLHLGKSSNQISYSILEGGSWRPSVEIGQLSKAAPVLAVFNGKLHMLHLGDRSNEIWYSTLEGDTWTPNVRIGQQSKATPVMAVFNDQLHMLHLGDTSNEIWYSTFDGNAWTRNVRIGQQSKATPVMAVFNGKLHMLHLGDSSDEIWYSTFDGNAWTRNLPIGQQGKATPVMAVFNGRLHMLYLGNPSNQIWYSYLDGGAWAPKVPLPDRSSKATPVMAGIGDTGPDAALHVVRTGSSSNYIFHGIIPPVPNAPSEVSFDNIGKRSARVSWKDNATIEERFTVYRSLHPTDDFKPVGTITVGCLPAGSSEGETYSFEDRSLEPGKAYYYRVRAENLGGPSDFSETARVATLPPNLPEAPGSLSIDAMKEVTESSIPIRWQDNADNETGFEVFVEETGRRYTIRQQNATGYTITSLNPNTTYCITVRAFNEDGFSENASNRVCATTSMSTAPAQLSASYWIGPFPQPGPCDPADLQWIFTPVQLTGSRGKDMQFMVPGRYRGELQSVLRPATGSQPGRIEWWCKYTGLLSDIRPGTWNVNVRSASWQAQCMVTLNSGSNMVNFTQFRNSCYTSPQPPAATMAGSIPSEREADHRNAALRGLKADPQPLGRSAAGGTIGRLDPDFGNNGLQTTAIFSNANGLEEQGLEVLTNAHGDMFHVLQVGSFIRVAKYLPGGRLDLSYGNAGYSNAVPLSGTSAAMQGDHIIIAGFMDGDFALARCTADGALDPAFGNNGIATTDFVGSFAVAQSVIVRGDRIMAGGYTFNATTGNSDFALARYVADGTLDPSFGQHGKVTTDLDGLFDVGYSVALQADKIILAGFAFDTTSGNSDFALVRYTADGALDSSFGGNGRVTTDFSGFSDVAQSVVVRGEEIIAAGYTFNAASGSNDFALARYTADGALDTAFGENGKVTTDLGSSFDIAYSAALQEDKIILAGYSFDPATGNSDFALARYAADGALDSSFGDNGRVTTDFSGFSDVAQSVIVRRGRIIAGGHTINTVSGNSDFALAQYTADGALDPSFGENGRLTGYFSSSQTFFTSTGIQGNKIVAAGYALKANNDNDFALARYTADGALDTSFGENGKVTTDVGSSNDIAHAMATQGDQILVAGSAFNPVSSNNDFALVRYTANGALDSTFGGNGRVTTDFNNLYEEAYAMVLQGERIILAGYAFDTATDNSDFALTRYTANGALDSTFGDNGRTTIDLNSSFDVAYAMALQGDKIIVAGYAFNPATGNSDFALTRHAADGALDPSFGEGGKVITNFNDAYETARSVALQGDKIIVAGYTFDPATGNTDFTLARYTADGVLDTAFGDNGRVATDLNSSFDVAYSMALQGDKIIVAGAAGDNFALARYTADGALDGAFGEGGIQTTNLGGPSSIQEIVLHGTRLYAAGSVVNAGGSFGVVAAYQLETTTQPTVSTFTLVDADTNQDLGELQDGDVIDFAALPASRISIRANTSPAVVGKVLFRLRGPEARTHTEYVAPYLLFANNKQDYFPWMPANGEYTLTATPYAERNGTGEPGTASTIAFQVINRQTAFRINVLGRAYTTKDGRAFSSDDLRYTEQDPPKFSLGYGVTGEVAGTEDDSLYLGQRWGVFGYNFPLPDGNYLVTLHFAEIYYGFNANGGVGSRRFNVDMEGTRKLTDYDVFFEAGGAMRAIQETFAVSVTDGNLDIDFLKGAVDWPIISAIEVVPATAARVAAAGTKGPEDWQVRAFPNPAARKLTVTTSVPVRELQETRVTDATGRVYLLNQHTAAGENQLEVNVAVLPGGLYLLRLQSRNGHRLIKFIKQ